MNIKADINLLKLDNAGIMTIKGRSESKRCVVIPIDENDIFVSQDQQTGKAKGAYFSAAIWENREADKFGNTHLIKQSFSKAYAENHSEEQMKQKPIIGNGKVIERKNEANIVSAPTAQAHEDDDLPF